MLSLSVAVLGSTGSVGVSTLDLLARAQACGTAEVEVLALTAGRNVALLAEQAWRWRPRVARWTAAALPSAWSAARPAPT